MKFPFTATICDCLPEIECIVDLDVEWDAGNPHLVINDVLCTEGKASLMHAGDKLVSDLGFRIADLAEDDDRLLARAVEDAVYEPRAA